MPRIKANEPLGERPSIIVLYGDPGICKTSIAHTCDEPVLVDFDRGVARSIGRKEVLAPVDWNEILLEEQKGYFKQFKTIGIDTAKAALDDFLMVHVVEQDWKLKTNKLGAYGAIGDAFKLFINTRRSENADILIIAHSKKDEDTKKFIPDVTGQSYQLLMRIADQVGYVTMKNGQRTISFEPSDLTVGKNVAALPEEVIPDKSDPAFRTFGARLFAKVREAIAAMSEEQREALELSAMYQTNIEGCTAPDDLTSIFEKVNELPDYLKLPLRIQTSKKAKEMGWIADPETKSFKLAPEPEEDPAPGANPSPQEIFTALTFCKSPEEIASLYFDNSEVIEADVKLKALFDDATAQLEKMGPAAVQPVQQTLIQEEKKPIISIFKKKYESVGDCSRALDEATDIKDIANLYYINVELVEANPELKAKFSTRKNEFYGDNTPPAVTPPVETAAPTAKKPRNSSKKEVINAAS